MTTSRPKNTPLDPALARWLEPLRELTPVRSDEESTGPTSAQHEARLSDDAYQLRRAEQIQKLRGLIRTAPAAQARVRRRSQWLWGFAAAAALAVAAGGTLFVQSQNAEAVAEVNSEASQTNLRQLWGQVVARRSGGRTEVLGAGASVGAGDELSTTAEAYASLDVGNVRVDLSSATTMELLRTESRDQSYRLRAGRVDVSVPHLPSEKQHLEVVTPDATVRVRGTVFSVEVDNQSGISVTRVQVTRGSVGVERGGAEYVVNAGQMWTSSGSVAVDDTSESDFDDTAETDTSAGRENTPRSGSRQPDEGNGSVAAPAGERPATLRTGTSAERSDSAERGSAEMRSNSVERNTPVERSSLREQNQLFSRALQAQRRGNARLAAQLFTTLLRKYPDSPLAASARDELDNCRAQLDQP